MKYVIWFGFLFHAAIILFGMSQEHYGIIHTGLCGLLVQYITAIAYTRLQL